MKFFFPDSQDLVDPSFDFRTETRSESRIRQRDDQYPHEIFAAPPYDGILVSKGIVDGTGGESSGRYTVAQRHRLLRVGVREFFRLGDIKLETMGDCGAFSYVREKRPPFSAREVIDFYIQCGFDYGLSVDHVILGYNAELDAALPGIEAVPEEWRERQQITFELAEEFMRLSQGQACRFTPVGIAQGWSPASYARAVEELQNLGYRYVAMGGMVPLKSHEILACLQKVKPILRPDVSVHLLGVTRLDRIEEFRRLGVVSFDSTSPLRQAFKDDKDNYYTAGRTYCALRVPQIEGNAKMRNRITAGEVNQTEARRLERGCIDALERFDQGECQAEEVVSALRAYELVHDGRTDRSATYAEILRDLPWRACPCEICRRLGIHVMMFRGAERNRRRGFHNLFVFYRRLREIFGPPGGRSQKGLTNVAR